MPRWARVGVLLALALSTVAPAPAPAAAPTTDVLALPATAGASELRLHPRGAQLCLAATGLVPSTADGRRTTCGDPTRRDDEVAVVGTANGRRASWVVGIVPGTVAAVRVAFTGGDRPVVAAVPVAGLPAPFAGRVAAFRVRVPDAPAPPGIDAREPQEAAWVEALDVTGRVVGVASTTSTQGGARVGPPAVRRLARRSGTTVEAATSTEEVLAPTLADVARTQLRGCLDVVVRRGGPDGVGGSTGRPTCVTALGADPFDGPVPLEGCGPPLGGVQGALPAGTTAAYARLGDGTRVRLRLTSLAPGAPGRVAVAFVAPAGQAVRSLELEPSERRLPYGIGPAAVSCAGQDPSGVSSYGVVYEATSGDEHRAPAALASPLGLLGGDLRAAEGPQGTLCLALGDAVPDGSDCAPLGRAPGAALVVRGRPSEDRAELAGVTGPTAASVRITLGSATAAGTRTIDVPTVPAAPGVGGGYAGLLRTFATALPTTAIPSSVEGRGAAGHALETRGDGERDDGPVLLGDRSGFGTFPARALPSRRLARVGASTAWRSTSRLDRRTAHCGAVTTGGRPTLLELDCPEPGVRQATVVARCGRAGLVVSLVLRGSARLEATTRAGDTLRARSLPVGGGASLAVLALGRRTGLRALAVTGVRDARRVRVDLRPAAAQCGYRTEVSLAPGASGAPVPSRPAAPARRR